MIGLMEVTPENLLFLYGLLADRPDYANISHRKMPTFEQHSAFVDSKPYTAWYVIVSNDRPAGAVYLTKQDEIGIHIHQDFRGAGIARKAIDILMRHHPRKRYLANIAPANEISQKLFESLGFTFCQKTYELIREDT